MKNISRRRFLGEASCAGLGYLTFMNSLINLKAIGSAAMAHSSTTTTNDYKAIVCIMKAGGNDSHNMLVPYDQTHYDEYALTRGIGAIALPKSDLLRLNYTDGGREYGLNPAMPELRTLFDQGKAAFVANVGTLLRPTTLTDYQNGYMLPKGLYSHSDQQQEWHTSTPDKRSFIGWGGRMADLINDMNTNDQLSMSISLSGLNVLQSGLHTIPYPIDRRSGSTGLSNYDPASSNSRRRAVSQAVDSLIEHTYTNIFERTFMQTIGDARDAHIVFDQALQQSVTFADGTFPDSRLGESLEMIARIINVRAALGFKRQVFFIGIGGWDHHSELINTQYDLLRDVSQSVKAFADALETMEPGHNLLDQVLTLNLSEFGRTLTWNGGGTDHAWGGNVWMMGGQNLLHGQRVLGTYPSLSLNQNPLNVHPRGRIIPTISTDEYYAEVARWFGVPNNDLPYVLPNISNFYDINSTDQPVGFINM